MEAALAMRALQRLAGERHVGRLVDGLRAAGFSDGALVATVLDLRSFMVSAGVHVRATVASLDRRWREVAIITELLGVASASIVSTLGEEPAPRGPGATFLALTCSKPSEGERSDCVIAIVEDEVGLARPKNVQAAVVLGVEPGSTTRAAWAGACAYHALRGTTLVAIFKESQL